MAVHVEDGRELAGGGHEDVRVHVDLALLEVPVGPHLALLARHLEPAREAEQPPDLRHPRAHRHDHLLDVDRALARLHAPDGAGVVELEAGHLHALGDLGARDERLLRQALDRLPVEREAAAVLVEADAEAGRAPVGEERAHVGGHVGLPQDQLGLVADPLLALVDGGEVVLLGAVAERDVAGAVVVERLGVGLPDLDAGGHQLGHRRLEVVVAHHAAGDPGRAGRHAGLVHHQHLLAALGEVPGRREAVHAGPDHEVPN